MMHQAIIEMEAGTQMENLPPVFNGLAALLELKDVSMRQMPGTRDFNNRMLVHMEVRAVENITEALDLMAAGIATKLGASWIIKASQSTFKHKQYDADGNPVMEDILDDDGVTVIGQRQVEAVIVDIPLSESYFLDFMPDVPDTVDADGNVLTWKRPTVATPHVMSGAEPWELVA